MTAPSAPQGGGVDGRAIAQARDAWQNSDEGRMLANDINGPVGGQYLRNRLEVAFCAGYEAALAAQPRTDAGVPDDTKVICPSCCHQFRAIPVRVQQAMIAAGFEPPFTDPPRTDAAQRAQGGGEVVAVTRHDAGFEPGPLFDPNGWDRLRALPKGTKLYTAPPSVPVGERIVDMQHLGATVVLHFESHERAGRYYARHADAVQASENAPSTPAPVAGDAVADLPREWRQTAHHMRKSNMDDNLPHADPYDQCADDLEAALAQDRASQAAAPSAPVGVE